VKPWRPDPLVQVIGVLVVIAAGCASDATTGSVPESVVASSPAVVTATNGATVTTAPTGLAAAVTPRAVSTARITSHLSADELAGQLTAIERTAGEGFGSVGQHQQLLYRYLAAHADLDDAVLALVGADVRPYVERIVRARQLGQAIAAADTTPSPPNDTLPAWTLVDPLPAAELLADYRDAEEMTGIPWYWLAAIHLQETRTGRIIGTSSAGAVGPMQFLPSTWQRCCTGDPANTRDAIIGAATYLSQSGGPTDMPAALNQYNPSASYVATVTAFAENMRDNPKLYSAYREWQVFYASSAGAVRLPIGYHAAQPIDAAAYLAEHPVDAG
jgi:membrane-bound lytic murein transglycosylase B